ncbi:hypothetical protein FB567DRAFT_455269, partial [Paraphoma chrysanthemicola]
VVVMVGKSKHKFYIHEALLRSNSGFFDAALKKEWAEGQDRIVKLPDKDPEIFKIWMKWIYTGRLFIVKQDDIQRYKDKLIISREWARWRKMFELADFLQDFDCKDAAIDALIEAMVVRNASPRYLPTCIYPHSTKHSAHRRLTVDLFVKATDREFFAISIENQPQEFIIDVMSSIGLFLSNGIEGISLKEFFAGETCKYHDHGPDKPCYKTKPAFRS